ncbi:hypothetical protein [Inconstantimicrobium mannanitabidum]|uniref:Uncharacterized protein n=1 Tax=Inconstantimicrobium mannanitabidum TaxID=1604901 RepID=A0ACB5RBH9_9CLOT|nr:hypothetical protein [Clostridium sp. TW13]GKX66507.1 hypothetical protein rsdtw13_17650 [Clostridium sp. TW13]
MNYLLIYLTVVALGLVVDIFRLFLAKLFNFAIEEFSIFMGPSLIELPLSTFEFKLKTIPYGSSIKFNESFLCKNRISRLIISYLPEIILFTIAFIFIKYTNNYVLTTSGILLAAINAISVLFSIVLDKSQVFYRYRR